MYAILFAGGVGQRLWPLSRKNTPKQFSPLIGDKSSFQVAVERLLPLIPAEHIYISTNANYADTLKNQAPGIPPSHVILEPARRDVAAAVALAFFTLHQAGLRGPVLFQWADNYVQNTGHLLQAIDGAGQLIADNPNRIVIIGETPRFPNENLGWVELTGQQGEVNGIPYYGLRSWTYRPNLEECVEMFTSGNYVWNSGYFVATIEFVVSEFKKRSPEIAAIVQEIVSYQGTPQEAEKLNALYPTIPATHFDHAFLERLEHDQFAVLKADLKWADPGSLYALKEMLQASPEANVTRGKVVAVETHDSLLINEEADRVVSVMGLDGVIVVNTHDTMLVISKHAVRYIARLLNQLEKEGFSDLL